MNDNLQNKGLRGWLIILGIGVVLSPLKLANFLLSIFLPIFTDGTWEELTTEGSVSYSTYWAPLLIFEFVFNFAMMIWSCYLVYLFFTKHYRFPSMYILIAGVSLFFVILDAFAATLVMPDEPIFDSETLKELAGSLFALVVWGTYLVKSERAKLTFIEKRKYSIDDNDTILDK
tara:strand:- start:17 stop:538 length:522 start_codon:yes stop_codon:yes gene_type:complete